MRVYTYVKTLMFHLIAQLSSNTAMIGGKVSKQWILGDNEQMFMPISPYYETSHVCYRTKNSQKQWFLMHV